MFLLDASGALSSRVYEWVGGRERKCCFVFHSFPLQEEGRSRETRRPRRPFQSFLQTTHSCLKPWHETSPPSSGKHKVDPFVGKLVIGCGTGVPAPLQHPSPQRAVMSGSKVIPFVWALPRARSSRFKLTAYSSRVLREYNGGQELYHFSSWFFLGNPRLHYESLQWEYITHSPVTSSVLTPTSLVHILQGTPV